MTGGNPMFAPTSKVPYTYSEPVHGRRHLHSNDHGNFLEHDATNTYSPNSATRRSVSRPADHNDMLSFSAKNSGMSPRSRANPSFMSQDGLLQHNAEIVDHSPARNVPSMDHVSPSHLRDNIISHDNAKDRGVPKTGVLYGNSILARDQLPASNAVQDGRARNYHGSGALWDTSYDYASETPRTGKRYAYSKETPEKPQTPMRGDPNSVGRVKNVQGAGNISHFDPSSPAPQYRPLMGHGHAPNDHRDMLNHLQDDEQPTYDYPVNVDNRYHRPLTGRSNTPRDHNDLLHHPENGSGSEEYRAMRKTGAGKRQDHAFMLDHM